MKSKDGKEYSDFLWKDELEEDDIVYCPDCCNVVRAESDFDGYEYLDGEEHIFKCECGAEIKTIISRPIFKQVLVKAKQTRQTQGETGVA
jgi:hypothetical protein